jgi:hypothetical protein
MWHTAHVIEEVGPTIEQWCPECRSEPLTSMWERRSCILHQTQDPSGNCDDVFRDSFMPVNDGHEKWAVYNKAYCDFIHRKVEPKLSP